MKSIYIKLIKDTRKNDEIKDKLNKDKNNIVVVSEKCPHCESIEFIKFGSYKGTQRYKCKNNKCGRTFTKDTNNPFRCSKKFKQNCEMYFEAFSQGLSLRECAKRVNITLVTAFFWRHRFLHDLSVKNHVEKISSYVEFTKLVLPENFKGDRKWHGEERDNIITINGVNDYSDITSIIAGRNCFAFNEIKAKIVDRIDRNAYIVGMMDGRLVNFCKAFNEVNKTKAKNNNDKNTHREYSIKIKRWLLKFHGVASKYLDNYLSWRAFEYKNNILLEEKMKLKTYIRPDINTYIPWESIKAKVLSV